ncbi:MAG: bifunctional ornithine acetyltransferase/N-acetylglutamate synthase [Methanobacteriaceae archaeon]
MVNGGICAVKCIKASGARNGKYGLAMISADNSYSVAGVFTSNKVVAAPIVHTKEVCNSGKISAIVANSGNANCFTGDQGIVDCHKMAETASNILNISKENIATASTGVIGREMPMDIILELINKAANNLKNSPQNSTDAAKAIMTTDTFPKEFAIETTLENGEKVVIGGMCKGSGMIAPNMGTMLCFLATDASAGHGTSSNKTNLQKALKIAVNNSFNMVIVDGDESTNDVALLIATGSDNKDNNKDTNNTINNNLDNINKSNNNNRFKSIINDKGTIDVNFQKGLNIVCKELAKMMAKDGEGATKFLEVEIQEAKTSKDARLAARAIIQSPLVKTAIFGEDPNWGRVVAALGYSACDFNPNNVTISFLAEEYNQKNLESKIIDKVDLVKKGEILGLDGSSELSSAENIMKNKNIKIIVNLHTGGKSANAYGCDFSYDYVRINAEYTT